MGIFWLLHKSINRIEAEKDLRAHMVFLSAQSTKPMELRQNLVVEMGQVAQHDPIANAVRDEEGVKQLKALAARLSPKANTKKQ